jgi:hypothetical protein
MNFYARQDMARKGFLQQFHDSFPDALTGPGHFAVNRLIRDFVLVRRRA